MKISLEGSAPQPEGLFFDNGPDSYRDKMLDMRHEIIPPGDSVSVHGLGSQISSLTSHI